MFKSMVMPKAIIDRITILPHSKDLVIAVILSATSAKPKK